MIDGSRTRRFKTAFLVAAALVVAATGVAYLATDATATFAIQPASSLPSGAATDVTPVSASITTTEGNAQREAGLEVFQIAVGNPAVSAHLQVNFIWLDPQEASQVLGNPHSWIQVGLYDSEGAAPPGGCPMGQYEIQGAGSAGSICVAADPGAEAEGIVTRSMGSVLLQASQANQSTVYVLASIEVPKGGVPPGQQGNLTTLQFYALARVSG